MRLEEQTRNAFDFIEKIYFEISHLIREAEEILQREEEEFLIGKPSGYGVTTRTSVGLEPMNVKLWLSKTFTVFFCPKEKIKIEGGQTKTPFCDDLKLLLLDIEIVGKNIQEPRILAGCLRDISCKQPEKLKKFEYFMAKFAYNRNKIFSALPAVNYEDGNSSFKGEFVSEPLFSIRSSDELEKKIIQPMLELYRAPALS